MPLAVLGSPILYGRVVPFPPGFRLLTEDISYKLPQLIGSDIRKGLVFLSVAVVRVPVTYIPLLIVTPPITAMSSNNFTSASQW